MAAEVKRTPYTRMGGSRRASVCAQDKHQRTSLYNQFLALRLPEAEWPAWRDANQHKARDSGVVPGKALTVMPKPSQHPDGYCDPVKAQITLPGSRPPRVVKSKVMA